MTDDDNITDSVSNFGFLKQGKDKDEDEDEDEDKEKYINIKRK
jgi:hypothetical protein